jgi:dimeric dUTPase (all-alpha-NTP-PPase superfamily)
MAKNCIYWFYCVANECKELVDWFDPKNHNGLPELEVRTEIAMESIDIIHFVMNIGLELRFTAKEIAEFEAGITLVPRQLLAVNADEANTILIDKCVTLIDVMPWKTWKTYPNDVTVADVKDLVANDYKEVYIACLRLCTSVGLDRQDIINIYFAKNKENHNRQDNGY